MQPALVLDSPLSPLDLSGAVIGAYRFVKPLHRGGMGTIYAGVHTRLRRPVAIKVPLLEGGALDPFLRRRLLAEARSLGSVTHPNVVTVHDLGILPDGAPFLVMELLEGMPLSRVLDEGGALELPLAIRVIQEVANGLAALHDEQIIDGDVKPDNVILVDGPLIGRSVSAPFWVKLVDLGTVQGRRSSGPVGANPDAPVLGTSWYMSPEAVLGFALDERSDVYSLTAMLYELIAGNVPFPVTDDAEALRHQLWSDPLPLSHFCAGMTPGGALDRLVAEGLAKGPDDRPRSMHDFLDRLASATPA
jgi:serine/threonine-protein kinase